MAALQIGQTFVQAVENAARAVVGLITDGMQLAGLFQEMEFAALATGRTMGMTEEEIRGAVKTINDLNIRYDAAAKTVAQFARNQVDMSKATELVRIAQGAGVLIQEDSSETLERLTWAVTTHNTMMLRRMGIMTDLQDAEERFAQAQGKSRDELTDAELVQADVNAVLKAGASLLDVYDAAMESPTKRLRSLTGRIIPEFKAALGAPFLDAWSTAIKAVSGFVEALEEALSEGGALYPIMINLGAAASIVADSFAWALGKITGLITGVSEDAATGIGDTIMQALQWGFELVASFAEGIVSATTSVLVSAMNAISNMLSTWLFGASPPKVAPNIVGWGISLMEKYLEGMTEADFGVLKEVQGPLKKVLEGPAFADISKVLAGALAGGDRAGFLTTVEQAAGVFGQALKELASLNFQLADSVTAVQVAEEALDRARTKATDSQADVNRQTAEYNRLLREGVSRDVLDAQLEQINAAEENMRAAIGQVDAQEEAVKAAKERKAQLEEDARLQKDVVDQLLAVNDALIVQDKETEKIAGAKGGAGLRPLGIVPEPSDFAITSSISTAIDEAKEKLKAKMAELMQPLRDAIANIKLDLGNLGGAWDNFIGTLGRAWDSFTGILSQKWDMMKERFPVLQDVEDWVKDLPGELRKAADVLSTVFGTAVEGAAIALGNTVVTGFLYNAEAIYNFFKDTFLPYLSDTFKTAMLSDFVNGLLVPIATGFTNIGNAIQYVIDQINRVGGLANLAGMVGVGAFGAIGAGSTSRAGVAVNPMEGGGIMQSPLAGGMLPQTQQLSPVTTNVTLNMGGNTFNNGMDDATFNARVEQTLRDRLRR